MAATPSGNGYWFVAADGGLFTFGDAGFFGSGAATPVSAPVVAMAATPSGKGYWLVGADGAVLAFGDAGRFGSLAGTRLNRPIVGMTATNSGRGCWLVAADGGVFSFRRRPVLRLDGRHPPEPAHRRDGGEPPRAGERGAEGGPGRPDRRRGPGRYGRGAVERQRPGRRWHHGGGHRPPTRGSAVVNADRTVRYVPNANASGSDQLTYGDTATGVVTVTILAVNDAPSISDVASQLTAEDSATAALGFTVGDVETAAASLTVTGSSDNPALVADAAIAFGGSGAGRTVTVTPAANQSGTATITVTVSDGSATASDTFVVTVTAVDDAATISDVADQTTDEDSATAAPVTVADVDTAAGSLTLTGTSDDTALVPDALGGSGASRTVTITPAANQSGTATITVTVSDGSATASDTFVLTVTAVNDAPVAVDQSFDALEDAVVSGILAGSDPDGSAVTFFPVGSPTGGSVSIGSASGTFTFTPAADFSGAASFQWKATTLLPPEDSNVATVTITYAAVNDAPTVSDVGDQTTPEDTATGAVAFTVGDVETAAGALVVTATSGNTTLVPDANIALGGSGASRTVTITPAANQSGTATITVTVSDGSATASDTFVLTVTAVNDSPVAVDDSVTVGLGASSTFDVLDNDTDVDNTRAQLTVGVTSSPIHGILGCSAAGECTYTRTSAGPDSFTYQVEDSGGLVATATVTIGD